MPGDTTVTLKRGTSVYQHPRFTGDRSLSRMPWNHWRERCQWSKDQLSGKMLFQDKHVTAVQLDRDPNFCGTYFNQGEQDRRVVFVKTDDVERAVPSGEDKTEARPVVERCPGAVSTKAYLKNSPSMLSGTKRSNK